MAIHYLVFKNGKKISSGVSGRVLPYVWTKSEVTKLRRKKGCYTVANTKTQKTFKVGSACRRKKR